MLRFINNHPEILILIIIAVIFLLQLYMYFQKAKQLNGVPDVKSYLASHPKCKTGHGICCYVCGSKSISLYKIDRLGKRTNLHLCKHCNTKLYQTDAGIL